MADQTSTYERQIAESVPDARARREAELYDAHALRRGTYDWLLDHADNGPARQRRDAFVREVMAAQAGRRVLEIGSSAWEGLLYCWRIRPASLTCINISQAELDYGRERARSLDTQIEFRLMDANSLQFPDSSFDFVFGLAILHHLDFARAMSEIHRVCAPGASILFIEPLAPNPVAWVVRNLTPRARTPDEKPLDRQELAIIERLFVTDHLYTDFLHLPAAIVSRLLFRNPVNALTRACDAADQALLRAAPALGPYFRTITVHGRKRAT
jgi:SAM-dependent methyltransferase